MYMLTRRCARHTLLDRSGRFVALSQHLRLPMKEQASEVMCERSTSVLYAGLQAERSAYGVYMHDILGVAHGSSIHASYTLFQGWRAASTYECMHLLSACD